MVNLFGAAVPDPRSPRTHWVKELNYIKNGEFTFTYKTLTSPTFSGTAVGPFDGSTAFTAAGGDRALQWYATHSDTLTGTLVTYYGRSTGGDSSGAGTIRGFEIGGRLIDAAGMKASVVTGGYSWADAKQGIVTTLRGFEASLDGAAGSTVTTASGVVIFNNSSGTQTNSYAVDINEGNPSGRKAFTADMRMQNGATWDNATNNTFEWNENSDELIWTFGSNTVTASSGDVTAFNYSGGISSTWAGATSGGIKIAPIATGTAIATIQNQNVAASTITLPSATTTLPGLSLANVWTNTNSFADDMAFSIGTTLTNAETKITMEFDETTTGIGQFNIGDLSNPQVLNTNPGPTVVASTININHSAGAGDCDDLLGSYSKVNVIGDGDAGITVVGDASRAYVGLTGGANNSVASQAYGTQAWARHGGTGAITAMSGLSAMMDVGAENFTANTINSGHFHIQGAADVTAQYDGVMIEAYPDVDTMDALLALATDSGADVAAGIRITGAPVCQMSLSSGAKIFTGTAANGDAVYAEVGTVDAVGSLYINATNGYLYIQVADAGSEADWYKVTASNAD